MSSKRLSGLMKRAGMEADVLDRCKTTKELAAVIEKLSDAQLLDAIDRAREESIRALSDDALLAALDVERMKPITEEDDA